MSESEAVEPTVAEDNGETTEAVDSIADKSRRTSQSSNTAGAAVVSFTKVEEVEGAVINSHTPTTETDPGVGIPTSGEDKDTSGIAKPSTDEAGVTNDEPTVAETAAVDAGQLSEAANEAAEAAVEAANSAEDMSAADAQIAAAAAVEAAETAQDLADAAGDAADAAADAVGNSGEENLPWKDQIRNNIEKRASADAQRAAEEAEKAAEVARNAAIQAQETAAIKLQAHGRRMNAKSKIAAKRVEKVQYEYRRESAAVAIQRNARAKHGRGRAENIRAERKAADAQRISLAEIEVKTTPSLL